MTRHLCFLETVPIFCGSSSGGDVLSLKMSPILLFEREIILHVLDIAHAYYYLNKKYIMAYIMPYITNLVILFYFLFI